MPQVFFQHQSLYDRTYEILKEAIYRGDIKPGARLRENVLVDMLGASKTPIKFALCKLEQDGLVKRIPRRGTYVIELTDEMIRELFLLTEALEGLAARLAATKISEKKIKHLGQILKKMKTITENSDDKEFVNLDEKFHEIILQASKHHRLGQILENLWSIIKMYKIRSSMIAGSLTRAYNEHVMIFQGLSNRDPKEAERSMRNHILQVWQNISRHKDTGASGNVHSV